MRPLVQAEPPGGGVAAVMSEVAPVLYDQPQPDEHDQRRGERVVDEAGERADAEGSEDEDAEVPVVPAAAEEVDARPEPVPLDPKTPAAPSLRHGRSAGVRLCDRLAQLSR